MYHKIGLFVLFLVYNAEAKTCPEVKPAKNFNITAFASGIWHDLARYPNNLETSKECLSLRYSHDGDVISLKNEKSPDGPNHLMGSGNLQPDGTIYIAGTIGASKTPFEVAITVVKVKYDKYAIKYSCIQNGDDIIEFAWVISRSADINSAAKAELNKFIQSAKVVDMNRLFWLEYSDKLCKKQ